MAIVLSASLSPARDRRAPVLVDDEGLNAGEVPQGALAFEHLGGPQAHADPSANSA